MYPCNCQRSSHLLPCHFLILLPGVVCSSKLQVLKIYPRAVIFFMFCCYMLALFNATFARCIHVYICSSGLLIWTVLWYFFAWRCHNLFIPSPRGGHLQSLCVFQRLCCCRYFCICFVSHIFVCFYTGSELFLV